MAETKAKPRGYVKQLSARLEEASDQVLAAWRKQARRPDRVGDISHRGLELVHGGLRFALRSLSHLERGTLPPHRAARPEPAPERHGAQAPARRPKPARARTAAARRVPRQANAS